MAFISQESGLILEDVKRQLETNKNSVFVLCADIACQEAIWADEDDNRFNRKRLSMADDIMEILI
jgi:hypothetical protein